MAAKQPTHGMNHLTVVPTNFDAGDDGAGEDAGSHDDEQSAADA
ncbi:hypothetical protein [Halobaculum sp. D14]